MSKVLAICFGFLYLFAHAENAFIPRVYHQVSKGEPCIGVNWGEQAQSLKCTRTTDILRQNQYLNLSLIEHELAKESAGTWVQINSCLGESLEVTTSDASLGQQYLIPALQAWLGMRRAALILEKCEFLFGGLNPESPEFKLNSLPPTSTSAQSSKRTERRAQIDKQRQTWGKLCGQKEVIKSLQAAPKLFPASLPLIGAPEVLDVISSHRYAITSKETGQPLTDEEILKLNFLEEEPFKNISADMSTLQPAVNSQLKLIKEQRNSLMTQVQAVASGESQDPAIYQLLYDEGSFSRILRTWGAINENGQGNRIASCIHSRYHPTPVGEAIDLGTTVLGGGGAYLAYKLVRGASKLTQGQKILRAGLAGLTTADLRFSFSEINQGCVSRVRNFPRVSQMADMATIDKDVKTLETYSGFFFNANFITLAEAPSCREAAADHLLETAAQATCTQAIFAALMPI